MYNLIKYLGNSVTAPISMQISSKKVEKLITRGGANKSRRVGKFFGKISGGRLFGTQEYEAIGGPQHQGVTAILSCGGARGFCAATLNFALRKLPL